MYVLAHVSLGSGDFQRCDDVCPNGLPLHRCSKRSGVIRLPCRSGGDFACKTRSFKLWWLVRKIRQDSEAHHLENERCTHVEPLACQVMSFGMLRVTSISPREAANCQMHWTQQQITPKWAVAQCESQKDQAATGCTLLSSSSLRLEHFDFPWAYHL